MTCRVKMAPMDQTVSSAVSVSTVTCLVTMSMELAIATWDTLATYATRVSDTLPSHELSSKCVCARSVHVCCGLLSCLGCSGGFFGDNCEEVCLCQNGAACHFVTGECTCTVGWNGTYCDQRKCTWMHTVTVLYCAHDSPATFFISYNFCVLLFAFSLNSAGNNQLQDAPT